MARITNLHSESTDLIVFLIGEELKSRKFFNTLQQLGLDNSYYQPHLDEAIMAGVGLTDESNTTQDFYYHVMEAHAEKIDIKEETVKEIAKLAYAKLKGIARS